MTEAAPKRRKPRHPNELRSVYDFLDEVRLRPGMWVRGSSLLHLDSMLTGFWVAEQIHDAQSEWDFSHLGPFSTWLWPRLGMKYPSALGWAMEIERAAEAEGRPGMELFFELLDEFRAEPTDAGPSEAR
ncbi:hypothetical protein [Streptomyces sp. KS 21]|uniref:hypothetical protein n=1 Tax=Streptomyces sp. KS 21 TaxID=2485150 RepID=UPI001063A7C9|nr:hypothetical protein [Streptomyces sp. KS 21]TDU77681.1 hypothetical protein EDD91_4440 [Streptomyces sp. KS 21]